MVTSCLVWSADLRSSLSCTFGKCERTFGKIWLDGLVFAEASTPPNTVLLDGGGTQAFHSKWCVVNWLRTIYSMGEGR
jgi:hypothetical protein